MKNLKDVKVGDVLDVSKRDSLFIKACFKSSFDIERAAVRLLKQSQEEAKKGWESFYTRWPELGKFHLEINSTTQHVVVKGKV